MISMLPIKMLFSLVIWATVIYTVTGCIQLMLFEAQVKKEDPSFKNYFNMSAKHKEMMKKPLFKILRGAGMLLILAAIKNIYS
jgi:hypothetical protein